MNRSRHLPVSCGVAALLLVAAAGQAQVRGVPSTYIGPDGGLWNDSLNWDNGVPNGDFDAFVNGGGAPVTVFVNQFIELDNLTIDAGNVVTIDNARELRMFSYGGTSTIDNSGTLRLDSTGSNTYLRLDPETNGDTFTLTGGGEVVAGGAGPNWIYQVFGNAVLHNVDNTIRGGNLALGWNNLRIINDGLILADSPGPLDVDPSSGADGFINNGTIRADGGTVNVLPGEFNNENGVIEALNGSIIALDGGTIIGGTLRGNSGGEVQCVDLSYLRLDKSPTLEGILRINDGRELRTLGAGAIENSGTILLDSTAGNTYFRLNPDVDGDIIALTGGGEVVASGAGPNWIYQVFGNAVLHNVDNTIRGGNLGLGFNSLKIINDGLVVADAPGLVEIDPSAGSDGCINNGTLRADGGTLRLRGGDFDNGNGVIEAVGDSVVELRSGTRIYGGTLRSADDGEIHVATSVVTLDLSTGLAPTIEGTLRILNGKEMRTFGAGTVNNAGTILLDSTGANTYFRLDPDIDGDTVMLTGGGELVANDAGPCWIYEVFGNAVLHNVDNTIRGGNLNLGFNSLPMINQGTIRADSDLAPIIIDPPTNAPGLDNQGTLEASGAAGFDIRQGAFTTSGTVDVALGSIITRSGDWDQTGGSTTVNGELDVSGAVNLNGGLLEGNGNVIGNVDNIAGNVNPGASAGTLTINGDYTQQTDGTLIVELGGATPGTQHDVLSVNGDAQLAGALRIELIDGFEPTLGDSFTILTTTGLVIDQFQFINCGGLYQVDYFDTEVIVSVVGEAVEGDLNCDGCVDQADLGILLGGYGTTDAGDLDGDGDTDQADLGVLLGAYGDGC
jgi:hypothetical protein